MSDFSSFVFIVNSIELFSFFIVLIVLMVGLRHPGRRIHLLFQVDPTIVRIKIKKSPYRGRVTHCEGSFDLTLGERTQNTFSILGPKLFYPVSYSLPGVWHLPLGCTSCPFCVSHCGDTMITKLVYYYYIHDRALITSISTVIISTCTAWSTLSTLLLTIT